METKYIAPYMLRAYLWEVLKLNTDMKETDYEGLVPIVPLAEEPELTEFNKPYIVYGYAESPLAGIDNRYRGSMSFITYSTNFRELSRIANIITRTFERADESARRVNEYTSTIPNFVGLRFLYTEIAYVEGGSPEETEGGRQSAAVNIRYEYTADYNLQTKIAPSTWP